MGITLNQCTTTSVMTLNALLWRLHYFMKFPFKPKHSHTVGGKVELNGSGSILQNESMHASSWQEKGENKVWQTLCWPGVSLVLSGLQSEVHHASRCASQCSLRYSPTKWDSIVNIWSAWIFLFLLSWILCILQCKSPLDILNWLLLTVLLFKFLTQAPHFSPLSHDYYYLFIIILFENNSLRLYLMHRTGYWSYVWTLWTVACVCAL